jgi:pilus assembly protein Flp/PilA
MYTFVFEVQHKSLFSLELFEDFYLAFQLPFVKCASLKVGRKLIEIGDFLQHMFSKLQDTALKLYVASKTLISDETGQDLIEYAILCALVAAVAIAATTTLSNVITGAFTNMGTKVNAAINNA